MIKTSIATVSLSGSLPEKLQASAAAGFDAVEIFENDLTTFEGKPSDIRQMAKDLGLVILALQPFRDLEAMPEPYRSQKLYYVQKKFELMHELGTDRLLCCSNVTPLAINDPERAAADMHKVAELAQAEGFIVGYEALAWGRHVADYEDAWDIVRRADHPALGINLDTFHMYSRGNTLDCLRDEIPVDKIALVQVADAPNLQMLNYLQYSRHFRCFPGQGDLAVVPFMEVLRDKGFDDYVSHEIFNDEFRASSAKDKAFDGMRSMIWLDEQVYSSADAQKPEITDFEFVEFAIDGPEGDEIVTLLNQLGFRETHRHRSKDVSLMRQGEINLVLNYEKSSQAHEYFQNHGASVCATALVTSSLKGSMARAERYRMKRFANQAGPGELNLPAIRGVGDSLVYLVERNQRFRFFDVDFNEVDSVDQPVDLLKRIDHVGMAVSNTDFLSAFFFYKALFEFDISAAQDLPDLYGLVTSRMASSPNGQVKIPINSTEASNTSPSRFIRQARGGGVQQLAFSTEDLFSFAEQIPAGLTINIPDNYYRDLEARFQIEPDVLDMMKNANILYDRDDEGGEFFHLYTREVQGVFIEVLERRAGYSGFGEANAPIRLAAQSKVQP